MLINLVHFFSFLSVLIYAVFYFKKSFEINIKYFSGYLFVLFFFGVLASYLRDKIGYNLIVYNILTFFEFNLLLLFFKGILSSKSIQKTILIFIYTFNVCYVLSSLYFFFFGDYLDDYNLIASIFGSIIITIVLFLFFKYYIYKLLLLLCF